MVEWDFNDLLVTCDGQLGLSRQALVCVDLRRDSTVLIMLLVGERPRLMCGIFYSAAGRLLLTTAVG